jgi:glyoxylase-like metal-dependent hydrolase (beta-lactamase superfamily II)
MNTTQALSSGQLHEIAPGVRRLVANNAGYMTGPGTNTYILGTERFALIDPGPVADAHVERLIAETGGRIDKVLVTHTHQDHSPAAVRSCWGALLRAIARTRPFIRSAYSTTMM